MPKKAVPSNKSGKLTERKVPNLSVDVYGTDGKVSGTINLEKEIFGSEASSVLLTQAVKVYLANQRIGTHSTKTRSEVTGSTKKIYRQKGTGRARHGDIKAPIFIGGGVAHGPKPQDYSLNFPKKMKKLALFGALTAKLTDGGIKVVKGMESLESKTKKIVEAMKNLQLITVVNQKKVKRILCVIPDAQNNFLKAGKNVEYLDFVQAELINPYEVLSHQNILFTDKAIEVLKNHYLSKQIKDQDKAPGKKNEVVKTLPKDKKPAVKKPAVKPAKTVKRKASK